MDESKLEKLQVVIRDANKLSKILTGEAILATDYTYRPTEFSKLISHITSHTANNSLTFTLNNGAVMQAIQVYKVDGKPPIITYSLKDEFIFAKFIVPLVVKTSIFQMEKL